MSDGAASDGAVGDGAVDDGSGAVLTRTQRWAARRAERRALRASMSQERRDRALVARLYWFSGVAPFVAALVWIAWPMVAVGPAVRSASHTADAGGRPGYFWLDAVADNDLVELWRADYNVGTVRLLAGEGWNGVVPLRRALDAVPEVEEDGYAQYCMVLENLVLAYEAQAEHTTDPDEALRAVTDARQLRKDPRCTDPDDDPPPGPSQNPDPDGQGGSGDDDLERQRQRELEERQRGSDADAEQFRQGGGTPDLTNPGGGRRPGGDDPAGPVPQDW
ncbi:MAG: hypothetical protein FWF02_09105 [Micrococcales bacterium]|nr:hypothetical protein [Micrococcales bacterium]MCL2667847.1 hypothetical protein [Micrococcales bacterium]